MSYHHSTASSVSREVSRDSNNNNLLSGDNLLRLALKKPESWKWELTTSSSSPNINFPKIQLFDSVSGELMVEVDQPDCVIRSDCATKPRSQGISTLEQSKAGRPQRYCRSRTSLVKEKLPTSGDSLADIFNQLSNKGLGHKLATSGSQYRLTNGDSDSSRHVLQKSKSASAIAMQEPPIVRRRSRKSVSSRSSSILERISEFYGRSSTDDEDFGDRRLVPHAPSTPTQNNEEAPGEENGVTIEEMPADPPITAPIKARPKIYKLVRSNAGTLMVREESFHTQRSLRRRQRDNLDGAPSEEPPQHERFVEVDDQTEPVVHVPSRYEQEINHIDHLLSRVMLSHDLQTEELPRHDVPNIRISSVEDDVAGTGSTHGPINHLQNGRVRRTRRHRRSVSVGSGVTSSRHRSISSGRSNSPADRTDRRRRSSSSSSEAECASRLNDPPAGYSSRSNSLKRRGRTRRRGDTRDSSTPKSNGSSPPPFRLPPSACSMLCEQSPAAGTVPHHRRRRHRSAESGHGGGGGGDGGNALALESFRASLRPSKRAEAESSSGEPAAPIDIDVPTIGAIGTPPDECKPVVVTASSTSSSSFSSSSSCTLSSLSPASEADQPSVTLSVTRSELARSLSVPCRGGDRVFDLLATPTFRNTVSFPLSGDQFRQLYSMQEPGGEPEGAPQEKRPLLLSPPESQPQQELLAEPPPKKMAGPVPTYAEVVGGSSSASAAVQDKPPSGQVVKPAITITSTEDDVEVVVESGLSNTVEPPMRGKPRTLKYYVRRHRSAFHKE